MRTRSVALLFALCATSLSTNAQDEILSPRARQFLNTGVATALRSCSHPWPPRHCQHGKLLLAGAVQKLLSSNSGEPYTYQELQYDGMRMVYRADEVVVLELTKPSWPKVFGLGVGSAIGEVSKALGTPTASDTNGGNQVLTYCDMENCVSFSTKDSSGVVSTVSWMFYYD